MSTKWVSVGSYCECDHSKSDHEYANDGACAYGWTDEPDEPEACPCEAFVYRGENVTLSQAETDAILAESWPPPDAPDPIPTPRKCRRHRWVRLPFDSSEPSVMIPANAWHCQRCLVLRDDAASRRGKNSRTRGNAYERSVAARLGVKRVGQYGGAEDVAGDWIAVQCKVGGYYPLTIDRWLRAIPARADRLRAVVIGDAPGSAGKRRELIVLDFGDFLDWFGGTSHEFGETK